MCREIVDDMRSEPEFGPDILEPLEVLGVDQFADSAVIIKARIKTRPIKQWTVGREFNRRMKKRFDELGIEIPFPHRTVYFGAGKDGSAAPGNLLVAQTIMKRIKFNINIGLLRIINIRLNLEGGTCRKTY